jgi:hypothetical protein
MALRIEKAASLFLTLAALGATEKFEFAVRHDHAFRDRNGTLHITGEGLSYAEETPKGEPAHRWTWPWQEIQQLFVSENRITVLTYQDSKWRLGVDREYTFRAVSGRSFADAYELLRQRLDQRLVAALAEEDVRTSWELPVKLRGRLWGSEGVLLVAEDCMVYRTAKPGLSRTWRYSDIEDISSSGPFELSITTMERSRFDFNGRRTFHFQLKQPLAEGRYNDLWRRVNRRKGLLMLQAHPE